MKTIALIYFLIFCSCTLVAQPNCNINDYYQDFISVEIKSDNGRQYLNSNFEKTKKKNCASEFINNNLKEIEYIYTNYHKITNYNELLGIKDKKELQIKFIEDLKNDTIFGTIIENWFEKVVLKTKVQDTINMNKLLNSAVKFFSIIGLTEEGYYQAKICVGINDLKNTELIRNHALEAFSFTSIFKNLEHKEYQIYDEFIKGVKELYSINLGIDREEKLLRSQGALYFIMKNSENLRNMLKYEYNQKKDYLPFVLID